MTEQMEVAIRLGCFGGVLAFMSIWETLAPRRRPEPGTWGRKGTHLLLVALNSLAVRLLIPVTAVSAALLCESRGWGLLHLVAWPDWGKFVLAVVALDLAIYVQHVLFHAVPIFWRLHRVHHADQEFDVTTGVRFHTLEILLSALIKLGAVLLIGPSAVAVISFEVLLNATSMFNHSNVRMPESLDRLLRWFVVTPDMHRVHHSVLRRETDSNYGFSLPWWDYLLGTYVPQPQDGHEQMRIGLEEFPDRQRVSRLAGILWIPFVSTLRARGPGA